MTQRTTTTATTSTPNTVALEQAVAATTAKATLALQGMAQYTTATPAEQEALVADMVECLEEGITPEDYCQTLAAYDTAAEHLASVGAEVAEEQESEQEQGEEQAPVEEQGTAEEQAEEPGTDPNSAEQGDKPAPVVVSAAHPAPTSSLAQANQTLAKYGTTCRKAADLNYRLASLAHQYVQHWLGAAPGDSQRSTAVDNLADEGAKWSEDSLYLDRATLLRRQRERVNMLLHCHGVVLCLGDGTGVARPESKPRAKGKPETDGRLPWGTLREFNPLVLRQDTEHAEQWSLLPSVADEARTLFTTAVAATMARKDVVASVARLMLKDAELELAAAKRSGESARIKAAELAVVKWGGKVEKAEQGTKPATKPATEPKSTEPKPTDKPATVKSPEPGKTEEPAKTTEPTSTKPTDEPATAPEQTPATEQGEDEEPDTDEDADQGEEGGEEPTSEEPGTDKPKPEPRTEGECRGENLLKAMAMATPKDAGHTMALALMGHEKPHSVLRALVVNLLAMATPEFTTEHMLRTVVGAMGEAPLAGAAKQAVAAATLVLNRKPAAPADKDATPAPTPATTEQPATVKVPA